MNLNVDTKGSFLEIAVNSEDQLKELFQIFRFLNEKNKFGFCIKLGDLNKDIFLKELHSFLGATHSGSLFLQIKTSLLLEFDEMNQIGDAMRNSKGFLIDYLLLTTKFGRLLYTRKNNFSHITGFKM